MSRFTQDDLDKLLRKNKHVSIAGTPVEAQRPRKDAASEPVIRTLPLGKVKAKKSSPGRFLVRVRSFRQRLADEDGLVAKYHIDCLRYAGFLPNDSPGICRIEITQEKCKKADERTEIELYQMP